ncbi:MAG: hypothetical protein PHR87_11450 [Sulfurospirillaceae bacterium]|nr:hypothetical protein [Sulfurospirillaceae bacterium]
MFDNKKILIGNWFIKVAREEINDEILLFSTKKSVSFVSIQDSINSIMDGAPKQYSPSFAWTERNNTRYNLAESEKKVLAYQYVSTNGYTIYLLDSHNINIINEIKNYKNKNKNIIIISANNYIYTDFSRSMLHLHIDNEINLKSDFIHPQYIKNLQHIISNNMNPPKITYTDRYKYYLEFLPIVKIIQSNNFNVIREFISFRLTASSYLNASLDLLLHDTSYHENKFVLDDLIDADIYLLRTHRILTSRLAIVIYRLSFFDLSANKTQIGLFFKKELNVKSTTINLNNLNIEFINEDLSTKSFRGYDLRSPVQTEYTIRVEIAKKLLKAGVDIKIITKATKLVLSKIL